jgi:hypothetical protein
VSGDQTVEQRIRAAQIVVAALAMGVLIFTGVVVGLVATGGMITGPDPDLASLPLYGAPVAALLLAVAPVVRRRILDSGPAPDRPSAVARWSTATTVSMALREGAGLLGLVLSVLAGSATWAVVFGVASVGAMVLSWPRGDDLRERLRRLPG